MLSTHLASVRAKIDRADDYFKQIDSAIKGFLSAELEAHQSPIPRYKKAEGHQLAITTPVTKPLDPLLPLIVGDCIHNLRSALDHLAFQLAVMNNAGTEAERKIASPICEDGSDFKKFARHKVKPFVGKEAFAALQELQPYETVNPAKDAVLWVLSELDNIDKHRLLILAEPQIRAERFAVDGPGGKRFEHQLPKPIWKPFKGDTEVIRFDFSTAFDRPGKVAVKVNASIMVQLRDTGLICDGKDLAETLKDMRRVVRHVVDDFGKRFFGD